MSNQPASHNDRKVILCIDDNRSGLEIRKLLLEKHGFTVLIASSGQTGLATLEGFYVDAVLLDYKMEGMDGEAVATQIRRKYPNLPVVLLSGYVAEIPERLLRMVDVFLVKGQPAEALFTALEAVTGVSCTAKATTGLPNFLDESERLVKSVQKVIVANKLKLEARKRAHTIRSAYASRAKYGSRRRSL